MGGGELGGGMGRSNVKNKKTYLGDDAGRAGGLLDRFLGMYGQNAQLNSALSDRLLGGQGYGASSLFSPKREPVRKGGVTKPAPALPPPEGGGVEAPGPGETAMRAGGGGARPGGRPTTGWDEPGLSTFGAADEDIGSSDIDEGGGLEGGGGPGSGGPGEPAANNPPKTGGDQYFADPEGNPAPEGGLVGTYEDLQKNPWQTGPGGDAETDVLGQYDWMSSGLRNADETGVYKGLGDVGGEYDQFGQENATDRFRKSGYGDMSDRGPNDWEAASGGTYGDIAGGPNADESALYGRTGQYGDTAGEGEAGAMDIYKKEAARPGYDDETKAAMTQEAMSTARSPFERARDRIVRANTARGNPASSAAAEIALARDEGDALGSAGRKNLIDQAQEAIRQRSEAATGMQGVQGLSNQRQQFGITSKAGQNAQQAGQRLQGAAGLGATGRDIQSRVAQGLEGMGQAQAAQDARKKAGIEGKQSVLGQKAAENAKQRAISSEGTKGKQGLFETMFQRKNLGTQGLQGLQQGAAGQFQTSLAGGGNLGGKTREDYTEAGNASGGI